MSRLHVPDAHAGMNAFAVPTWWASLEDERVTRDDDELPDVTLVELSELAWRRR